MRRLTVIGIATLLALFAALFVPGASAHHPFSNNYDRAKAGTLTGTIVSVKWTNPHVVVGLEVKSAGGATERWAIEGLPPNTLRRLGWTQDLLRVGSRISISGWHARNADLKIFFGSEVTFEDGSQRDFGQSPDGADNWKCGAGDCESQRWIPSL